MSDREKDMGRLAAREQEKEQDEPMDADNAEQEGQGSKERQESQERQENTQETTQSSDDVVESASEQPVNVKDRGATMFAYLPNSLDNDVDLACQSVNLTYQQESGEKLGKNRYLYPIILMVGADNAIDLSYEEIQDLVERVDEVEDAD